MRDLELLAELADGGKAINAAEARRQADAGAVVVISLDPVHEDLLEGGIETYQQLVAHIVRILALAAPIAAMAINPKKFATQDVGQWVNRDNSKPTGRKGWEIYGWQDHRLWLYQGELGRLAQQGRYTGTRDRIREATYQPDGRIEESVWEDDDKGRIRVGPYDVTEDAEPYARYIAERRAGRHFFAFCERTGVLGIVLDGVSRQLGLLDPPEPTAGDYSI